MMLSQAILGIESKSCLKRSTARTSMSS